MDPMGGIVMTNDGNAILREITVQHPAAKTMIEIARTQDEEVGDGTTSVIILAAEVLGVSHQFLEEKMHPTVVIQAYRQALEDAANILRETVATPIDMEDKAAVRKVIQSCVGTKFIAKWSDLACDIAMDAVKTVTMENSGKREIDIKRYAKVEKISGKFSKLKRPISKKFATKLLPSNQIWLLRRRESPILPSTFSTRLGSLLSGDSGKVTT